MCLALYRRKLFYALVANAMLLIHLDVLKLIAGMEPVKAKVNQLLLMGKLCVQMCYSR